MTEGKGLDDFSAPVLEAWAVWEVFRRLGFRAEDIFWVFEPTVNAVPGPGLTLSVKLVTQGMEFRVTCSPRLTEEEAKDLERESRELTELLNSELLDQGEMERVFDNSYVYRNKVKLLSALHAKGFAFPFQLN